MLWLALLSAYMALFLALGEVLDRGRAWRDRLLLASIYLLYGLLLFHGWALFSGAARQFPHLLFWNGPLVFLIAPLSWRFFQKALNAEPSKRDAVPWSASVRPFLPFVVALLASLPVLLQSGEAKLGYVAQMNSGRLAWPALFPAFLFAGGIFYQLLLLIAGAYRLRYSLRLEVLRRDPRTRFFVVLLVAVIALCVLILFGIVQRNWQWTQATIAASALLIPALYLTGRYNPHFLVELEAEVKKARYEYSRLAGVDLDAMRKRLEELMEQEELYCEEDLSLEALAERLAVTPHQVSEFFNARLGLSFATYINGYRIRHAQRLLEDEPTRSILSIAYDSGFGAKSTFNLAFQRHCGQSPSEYRRQRRKSAVRSRSQG